ncbi:MAG: VanZ family protein [Oscillospiraceae bacterium]
MSNKRKKICNIILGITFIVYLGILFAGLFLKKDYSWSVFLSKRELNIIPFKTIYHYITLLSADDIKLRIQAKINFLGNIGLFLPLGVYLSFSKNSKQTIIRVFLFSLVAEIIQLILNLGTFDIDDIILNTIGGFIGAVAMMFLMRLIKNPDRVKLIVSIAALLMLVIVILNI